MPAPRVILAVVASAVAVVATLAWATTEEPIVERRPNVVLIVSDDQSFETIPHDPAVMPYLQGRIEDPSDHWVRFPNAFVNTPLCCPSRATILSGRPSHETGVRDNDQGARFDDTSTIATWLHDAGYTTGFVGKYLNGYPFGSAPFVPPGWDEWSGKVQGESTSVYEGYTLIRQGIPVRYGSTPEDYATDVFGRLAASFILHAPADRPFFLLFAPTASHEPWTPAPRHAGAYVDLPVAEPLSVAEADVSDKSAWVRALPPLTAQMRSELLEDRRRAYETLLALDDAVRGLVGALEEGGELENTVIVFLTDNGFSFGEHRWVAKSCPYEECIRTPFLVRVPEAVARTEDHVVSTLDVAPTIAAFADVPVPPSVDGRSLVPLLRGDAGGPKRVGVLSEFVGDDEIPAWWEIRTADLAYIELATGERELYDLTGVRGAPDPYELENRIGDPSYAGIAERLARALAALRAT